MLPDFEIAPVRRVLYGMEADIYTFSASECIYASFLRDLYGNYYYRLQQSEFFLFRYMIIQKMSITTYHFSRQ
jgi:hypothetical protein